MKYFSVLMAIKLIIHKLKRNGISRNLLSLLTNFLRKTKQRVILNSQSSSWANINAGVPQGFILGRLQCLIHINDLSDNLQCNPSYSLTTFSCFLLLKCSKE